MKAPGWWFWVALVVACLVVGALADALVMTLGH